MNKVKFILFTPILLFSSLALSSPNGLFHTFETGTQCPTQKIHMDHGPHSNNYSFFIEDLALRLQNGEDPCTLPMALNLQSFIRYLILSNEPQQFRTFLTTLNQSYQSELSKEQSLNKVCRLHSNPQEKKTVSCLSDHLVDIAVLANRAWMEYFSDQLSALHSRDTLLKVTGISAGGVGVTGIIFRSQIKRAGIKVIKRLGQRLRSLFGRNSSSVIRGGAIGTGHGVTNDNEVSETEKSLSLKIEAFDPPLEFIKLPNDKTFDDQYGYQTSLLSEGLDLGVMLGAGILPTMLAESQVYRLAYLIPSLGTGFAGRAALAAKNFIKSPLGKFTGAIVAAATVGKFLLDEWNAKTLNDKLSEVHGNIQALKYEIALSEPNSLSTYLMTQELVTLSQTLSLFYATPITGKMEAQFQRYSTYAICMPIHAAVHNDNVQAWRSYFLNKFQPSWRASADKLFSHHPHSWYLSASQLFNKNTSIHEMSLEATDLFGGMDPMELALKTIFESLQFIESHLDYAEYQGLKTRLNSVANYLLLFKSSDEYDTRLQMAVERNISQATPHASALIDFHKEYSKATAPNYSEIPVETWNRYIQARSFFEGSQKEALAQGYGFSCDYGLFKDLFLDIRRYRSIVPCQADQSKQFNNCVDRLQTQ